MRPWHACYEYLNTRQGKPPTTETLDQGWTIHDVIDRMFPRLKAEARASGVFSDPELPFDITYHPDLYDAEHFIVYEIKPVGYCLSNLDVCIAQLSGYRHFLQAHDAEFLLYRFLFYGKDGMPKIEGPWPWRPPFTYPWDYLRRVCLEADARLVEREQEGETIELQKPQ